jgi:hypothetical protein
MAGLTILTSVMSFPAAILTLSQASWTVTLSTSMSWTDGKQLSFAMQSGFIPMICSPIKTLLKEACKVANIDSKFTYIQ